MFMIEFSLLYMMMIEFDFKIIDIGDAEKYKETHWVLEDLGHKLKGCWGIK